MAAKIGCGEQFDAVCITSRPKRPSAQGLQYDLCAQVTPKAMVTMFWGPETAC